MKSLFLDTHIESKKWTCVLLKNLNIASICNAILKHAAFLSPPDSYKASLSLRANIIFVDDTYNKNLNLTFREKNKPTNVLSFPLHTMESPTVLNIGDIYIAYEIVLKEAKEQNKTVINHLIHLIIHGILHLLGYDHEKESDACQMESLEILILEKLNVQNPYCL